MTGTSGQTVFIQFRLVGANVIEDKIALMKQHLLDIRPVGDALISYFRRTMREQFDSEGAYLAKTWAPLAPSTLAEKTRKGTAGKGILRDTDDLYHSLVSGGPGAIAEVSEKRIAFGSSIYYLKYLDYGTSKMPARPVYGDEGIFIHNMERKFSALLADHVMGRPLGASGEISEATGGGGPGPWKRSGRKGESESFLGKAIQGIRETIQEGREQGDQWAESWSTTGSSSGGTGTGRGFG